MTSRISSTSTDDPRDESQIESRVAEIKEAYVDGEFDELRFEELLDAAFSEGPPYRASTILQNRGTTEVPTPPDRDEHVVQHKGEYYTIDGNIARLRETPDWENVVNVTGNGRGPDEDEIERIEREGTDSEEVKERQAELRRQIVGRGERY